MFVNVKVDEWKCFISQIQCSVVAGVIYNFRVHVKCEVGMKFIFCMWLWLDIDRGKKFIQLVYLFIYIALICSVAYLWLHLTVD